MKTGRIFKRRNPSVAEHQSKNMTPYVQSPSALHYPGVKIDETPEPAPTSVARVEAKRGGPGLPRCQKCGWSVGYSDRSCSNCGETITRRL